MSNSTRLAIYFVKMIKKMEEEQSREEELYSDSPKEKNDEEETSSSENEVTPSSISAIACLTRKEDMKRFEETHDCFILDFDPSETLELSNLSLQDNDDDDLSVLAVKGPVPCRDYPHQRHLCLNFPFKTTPHESYCEMCFCYVCDLAAPCKYWNKPLDPHCNADNSYFWKEKRNLQKEVGNAEEAR